MFQVVIEKNRRGTEWYACEISPIPGQRSVLVLARPISVPKADVEAEARAYLRKRGSLFKAERSVVGA
jgi:hypothetical protein